MYRYYCIKRKPMDVFVELRSCCYTHTFSELNYFPEIDRMAWGFIECEEELTPKEVADYGLIMQPREVEP